jgi:hypothetical protein
MQDIDKKIIALMPVKNEGWILRDSLTNLSEFCDHIIIGDQMSTDDSREIYKEFPKVLVIDNDQKFHSNNIRWRLLDEARKIPGEHILVLLDADEILPAEILKQNLDIIRTAPAGSVIQCPWLNLWKQADEYRSDGYWKDLTKNIFFIDDRKSDYVRESTLNDHTDRTPQVATYIKTDKLPVLHLEFLFWKKAQIKQAWYRCSELINKPEEAKKINNRYKDTKEADAIKTSPLKPECKEVFQTSQTAYKIESDWRYEEMLSWFNKYGIEFFEPLDIWHVEELYKMFEEKTGRKPQSVFYPWILTKLNDIKNRIKNDYL